MPKPATNLVVLHSVRANQLESILSQVIYDHSMIYYQQLSWKRKSATVNNFKADISSVSP